MQLKVTSPAKEQLEKLNTKNYKYLLLWYDTDGCGCGVNGVPTIRLTNDKMSMDLEINSDFKPTIIHKQQALFFDKQMKLDFMNGTFRLSSPQGILNPFISSHQLLDERKVEQK